MVEALIAWLLLAPTVTALVKDRVRMTLRAQSDKPPCAVVTIVGGAGGHHHGGADGLSFTKVWVDCWGKTPLEARQLAFAITAVLDGAVFEHGGVNFEGVFVVDESDGFDGEAPDRVYRTRLVLRVQHSTP